MIEDSSTRIIYSLKRLLTLNEGFMPRLEFPPYTLQVPVTGKSTSARNHCIAKSKVMLILSSAQNDLRK